MVAATNELPDEYRLRLKRPQLQEAQPLRIAAARIYTVAALIEADAPMETITAELTLALIALGESSGRWAEQFEAWKREVAA